MSTAEAEVTKTDHRSERARVEAWRLHCLHEAGYPAHLAERIAASSADLHQAIELVESGCPPETAAKIVL